jgi:hypothetical protein
MARAQGYVSANPVAALDRDERPAPEADRRPVQVLDEAQVARLLEHARAGSGSCWNSRPGPVSARANSGP